MSRFFDAMNKSTMPSLFVRYLDRWVFRRFGYTLRLLPHPTPPLEPWWTDREFLELWGHVADRTRVEPPSAYMLRQLVAHSRGLGGEIAEVGSYRGGSAYLLAVDGDRWVHVFDTFAGMPETDPRWDHFRQGDFGDTSLQEVRDFLAPLPHVTLYPGVFPDTAGPIGDKRFGLVHVDVDIHQSVLECCRFFYPRLVPGGILVFDDYGFPKCPGAKKAVDEFFLDLPETPLYTASGQAIVVRRPWMGLISTGSRDSDHGI
ncbi:MAG: class I SAM-dependent methyltransferase [Magnetococcales bacterium]|nr:class I SAM-dependent methyltransferase [Magnetococcales bacterium]MBF0149516.1 class I SAM-dependent methyltransferase [Magnetococcales bacterium]MBF0630822.1 class I SAM-dependent methyltransferase [Magnetococcales bacterium]